MEAPTPKWNRSGAPSTDSMRATSLRNMSQSSNNASAFSSRSFVNSSQNSQNRSVGEFTAWTSPEEDAKSQKLSQRFTNASSEGEAQGPHVSTSSLSLRQFNYSDIVLTDKLGKGGFGDVYKATWLGTPVAVKRCDLDPDLKDQVIEDFRSEAGMMTSLSHPHIVQMMAVCFEPLCIMMELMTKNSLEAEMRAKKTQIDWGLRMLYLQHGARGMAYLHGSSVIHSDLKPANMLIDEHSRLKIADFGLSKVARAGTGNTRAKGYTEAYASPELLKGQVEFASDVFAFGVIMWELHECKRPWYPDSPLACILTGKRPPVPQTMHTPYRQLMEACWAENPADRPRFLQVLEGLDKMIENAFWTTIASYKGALPPPPGSQSPGPSPASAPLPKTPLSTSSPFVTTSTTTRSTPLTQSSRTFTTTTTSSNSSISVSQRSEGQPQPVAESRVNQTVSGVTDAVSSVFSTIASVTGSGRVTDKKNPPTPFEELVFGQQFNTSDFPRIYQIKWQNRDASARVLTDGLYAFRDFRREYQICKTMAHPSIATMYGVCENPWIIITEPFTCTLYTKIHRGEEVPWPQRLDYMIDVAEAMSFMHKKFMFHRGLCTHAIGITPQNHAKILDIKAAKRINSDDRPPYRGHVGYFIHEPIKDKEEDKADAFAYGMMLWEIHERKIPSFDEVSHDDMLKSERPEFQAVCKPYATLVDDCWAIYARRRPSFALILKRLKALKKSEFWDEK